MRPLEPLINIEKRTPCFLSGMQGSGFNNAEIFVCQFIRVIG
ncbi:hypothetical protein SynBOUM118_01028 [Synechococcus sp. BOUM118]|nr:hypothetical protein SynBOUM118_01028 [Synechococcus sp. BOUM118]